MKNNLNYELKLMETASAAGYFLPVPTESLTLNEALSLLALRPMDTFLHQYILQMIVDYKEDEIRQLIKQGKEKNNQEMLALACEQLLLSSGLPKIEQFFSRDHIINLQNHTPLINLRWVLAPNRRLHKKWIAVFRDNLFFHKTLPALEKTALPPICQGECAIQQMEGINIDVLQTKYKVAPPPSPSPSLLEIEKKALKCLEKAGVILGEEMRHQSSLSPFALMRTWEFSTVVDNGRNQFSMGGTQTSYGKGLSLEQARVSLSMEIVERCSAFGNFSSEGVEGYEIPYPITYSTFTELERGNTGAVNPKTFALEIEYNNEPLHWIEGYRCKKQMNKNLMAPILIPVQTVFLFSNLDEVNLFSGLGSTGFASGTSMEQAKVTALLEVIERHQENTVPFSQETCFRLISEDRTISNLLESYRSLGIDILFQDITPAYGIPCCKCFVRDTSGTIHKGTSAHLNAKKAILSALTETPYPFPGGPPSAKALQEDVFTVVGYENLPDYSTGSHASDLAMLEALLVSWGKIPHYVELTRKDIGLPVVRAIIPGMEILGDFDQFSRVHPELFQHYLKHAAPDYLK